MHRFYLFALVALGLIYTIEPVSAQHFDVMLQDVNRRLTSGSADFDTGQWTLGRRVFTREFDSDYAVSNPGFNSLAFGSPSLPAGSEALPPNTPLGWDFLPMKVDAAASNLFYWNGAGTDVGDVQFGDLPGPEYKLSLFGKFNAVGVTGAPDLVSGDVIDDTSSTGVIHRHRFFFLDDGDDNAATTPADGIYLLSFRATMAGLDSSKPIYVVWGTPGSTLAALQAAESWVVARVDELAPDFSGDFDGDLDVDGSDFLTWQRNLGNSSALHVQGDSDRDRSITDLDLDVWTGEFGLTLSAFPGASSSGTVTLSVPEPLASGLFAIGLLPAYLARRDRRRARRDEQECNPISFR